MYMKTQELTGIQGISSKSYVADAKGVISSRREAGEKSIKNEGITQNVVENKHPENAEVGISEYVYENTMLSPYRPVCL